MLWVFSDGPKGPKALALLGVIPQTVKGKNESRFYSYLVFPLDVWLHPKSKRV